MIGWSRLPKGTDLGRWRGGWMTWSGPLTIPVRTRRVLIFATLPYWVDFLIPVGLVLAARGCAVDYAWMPYYLVDREQPADPDVTRPCDRLLRLFPALRLHSRFRLFNLLQVEPAAATDEIRQVARACSTIDPPYIVRRELFDIEADAEARRLFEFRTVKNLDCMLRLRTLRAAAGTTRCSRRTAASTSSAPHSRRDGCTASAVSRSTCASARDASSRPRTCPVLNSTLRRNGRPRRRTS
jgi:hypothetical protein